MHLKIKTCHTVIVSTRWERRGGVLILHPLLGYLPLPPPTYTRSCQTTAPLQLEIKTTDIGMVELSLFTLEKLRVR